ncbi:hypothetical protein DL93DRAFT_2079476 [Clavulina sp. PMI_390]|nr:hypothetical protein DL93DRAFT_2079476 [Clavulina sp. PMI_390]
MTASKAFNDIHWHNHEWIHFCGGLFELEDLLNYERELLGWLNWDTSMPNGAQCDAISGRLKILVDSTLSEYGRFTPSNVVDMFQVVRPSASEMPQVTSSNAVTPPGLVAASLQFPNILSNYQAPTESPNAEDRMEATPSIFDSIRVTLTPEQVEKFWSPPWVDPNTLPGPPLPYGDDVYPSRDELLGAFGPLPRPPRLNPDGTLPYGPVGLMGRKFTEEEWKKYVEEEWDKAVAPPDPSTFRFQSPSPEPPSRPVPLSWHPSQLPGDMTVPKPEVLSPLVAVAPTETAVSPGVGAARRILRRLPIAGTAAGPSGPQREIHGNTNVGDRSHLQTGRGAHAVQHCPLPIRFGPTTLDRSSTSGPSTVVTSPKFKRSRGSSAASSPTNPRTACLTSPALPSPISPDYERDGQTHARQGRPSRLSSRLYEDDDLDRTPSPRTRSRMRSSLPQDGPERYNSGTTRPDPTPLRYALRARSTERHRRTDGGSAEIIRRVGHRQDVSTSVQEYCGTSQARPGSHPRKDAARRGEPF